MGQNVASLSPMRNWEVKNCVHFPNLYVLQVSSYGRKSGGYTTLSVPQMVQRVS